MMLRKISTLVLGSFLSAFSIAACGDDADPISAGGSGKEQFTTWGEEFIEDKIPAGDGESGFIDGWELKYSKFLVNYHEISVADDAGKVVFKQPTSVFVDNVKPGVKNLFGEQTLPAKAYTKVSYQIKPAAADATVVAGDPADLAMMVANGYSIFVSGTATKGAAKKTFSWGFKTATQYKECQQAPEDNGGSIVFGIVVTNGSTDTSQLTTHGDHLYYNRLQASADPSEKTVLRFDEKAQADDDPKTGNQDGDVSLQELCALQFDTDKYNQSGFSVASIGDFVIELARTIGHYRGEGECEVSGLEPKRAVLPCDDYK